MLHKPVLLNEVVESFSYLKNGKDSYFVDGTFGAGNHSIALAKKYKLESKRFKIIGIDKDEAALEIAKENALKAGLYDVFILVHDDYKNIKNILRSLCHSERSEESRDPSALPQDDIKISGALLDLGVSSMQFDEKERGFSFSDPDQLLDMRMDQTQKLNATTILNYYSEKQIEQILREYGEERFAKYIARKITLIRKNHRFETVGDLLCALKDSIPKKIQQISRIHYATKTFQALRIEVNHELEFLGVALKDFISLLSPGSRLAVISFHSLEDRIVKNTFRELAKDCICPKELPVCNCNHRAVIKILTKHPITATEEEIESNPRSRSAKLRIAEKIVK